MHRGPERRGSIRFALSLEVSYTVLARRKPVRKGAGRTIDLSSSGLSFSTDGPLLTGQRLEVSIDWPVLLDGAMIGERTAEAIKMEIGSAYLGENLR